MGIFFFATCFRQIIFFCAKNIFSSHLATMAIGSANPEHYVRKLNIGSPFKLIDKYHVSGNEHDLLYMS